MTKQEIKSRIESILKACNQPTWFQNEDGSEYEGEEFDQDKAVDLICEFIQTITANRS